MDDIKGFKQDLNRLAKAVGAMQQRLDSLSGELDISNPKKAENGPDLFLMRRKQVLAQLGLERKVGRASWSHDNGESIIFDAWNHRWTRDEKTGRPLRYPMRDRKHYNLAESIAEKNRGHTRWQHHVDMVLAGQRSAIAIMPVKSASDDQNRRTMGWLPQYVTGKILDEGDGEFWFHANEVIPI